MTGFAHVRSRLFLAEEALKLAKARIDGLLAVPEPLRNPAAINIADFNLRTAHERLAEAAAALAEQHPPAPVARHRYGRHRAPTRNQNTAP